MERDDSEPAAWLQDRFRRDQRMNKLAKFIIDRDAQRLERPRRRVQFPGLAGATRAIIDASAAVDVKGA